MEGVEKKDGRVRPFTYLLRNNAALNVGRGTVHIPGLWGKCYEMKMDISGELCTKIIR